MANPFDIQYNNSISTFEAQYNLDKPKKKKPLNENIYEQGTLEYDLYNTSLNEFNNKRGIIFGTSKKGLKEPAYAWNDNEEADGISGLLGNTGNYINAPLSDLNEKDRSKVINDRKKLIQYANEHNLYTPEDWEKHEIKDNTIKWLWEENDDIDSKREDIYSYLKLTKDYGFKDSYLDNKPKEKTKERKLIAPIIKEDYKPISVLPEPDPIDNAKPKPKKQGKPLDIPEPIIAPNEKTNKVSNKQLEEFSNKIEDLYDFSQSILPQVYSKATDDLKKSVYEGTKLYEPSKEELQDTRQFTKRLNTIGLVEPIVNNIDVRFNKDTKEFTLDNKIPYKQLQDSLRNKAIELMDQKILNYTKQHDLSEEEVRILKKGAHSLIKMDDEDKSLSWYLFGNTPYADSLPHEFKDIANEYVNQSETLRILEADKRLKGNNKIVSPEWVDLDEVALSGWKGLAPTVINDPISRMAGSKFDIASFLKSVTNRPDRLVANLMRPQSFFNPEQMDEEVWNAMSSIAYEKYNLGTDETKALMTGTLKEIEEANDTYGRYARTYSNIAGELIGEVMGPFKIMNKGIDKIADTGKFINRFIKNAKIDKFLQAKPFKDRMLTIQRAIEGEQKIGGKVMPHFDEIFGFAPTNVARVTLASYGSQLFWHGADPDQALESAENMFMLEVLNNAWALGGIRANNMLGAVRRGLTKGKAYRGVEEIEKAYIKRMNTVYALSSIPAQIMATGIQNPDASSKEFAGELLLNFIMTGNNFHMNKELARDIKQYKDNRVFEKEVAENWTDKNREKIIIKEEELPKIEKNLKKEKTKYYPSETKEVVNEKTGEIERITEVFIDKRKGLDDFGRELIDKKDKRKIVKIKDYTDIVNNNISEDLKPIVEKLFKNVGDVKIKGIKDDSMRPAYYDPNSKTIFLNNNLSDLSTEKGLTNVVIHEGIHALTVDKYNNDKVFAEEINTLREELINSDNYKDLITKLEKDNNSESIRLLEYAVQTPEELLVFAHDPQYKSLRQELEKTEGNWINRIWDSIKKLFGKDTETQDNVISRLRAIVEDFEYNPNQTPKEATKNESRSNIEEPALFMPSLINDNILSDFNSKRIEKGLDELNENDLIDLFKKKYNSTPNALMLENFAVREANKLTNLNKGVSISTVLTDVANGKESSEDLFIDKSSIRFAELFDQNKMGDVYRYAQDKSEAELKDLMIDKIKQQYPDGDDLQIERISTYQANRIKQTNMKTPRELVLDKNGNLRAVNKIRANYYSTSKPLDKTMGEVHYLHNFVKQFPKSFRKETGELKPYVSERIDKFFQIFNPNNITKIAGIDINGSKSETMKNKESLTTGRVPVQLLEQGYYMLPRGTKEEILWEIPGIKTILKKPESAIDFGRQTQRFSFFKWLDSDGQWIGSKEGAYTGRRLAQYGGVLDYDKLIDKYIKHRSIEIEDLLTKKVKDLNKEDIDLIGKKLQQYYTTAEGNIFAPLYHELFNGGEVKKYDTSKLVLESITDLLTWGLDTGGGSRTILLEDNKLITGKNPWKYHSIFATNDPLFINSDYAKPFFREALNEDGNFDTNILKEYNLEIDNDGNLFTYGVFPNEEALSKNPYIGAYFNSNSVDGGSPSMNTKLFSKVAEMMLKDPSEIGLIKPKGHKTDDNGNMFIYKSALYDYGNDEYFTTYHKELEDWLKTIHNGAGIFAMNTSSKGNNTFRTKEHQLKSTDNPNARALFNNTGNLVDVIVKSETGIKSDKKLFEQELEYIKDNWAKGIIDPRSKVKIPITGNEAIVFIETSHPIKKLNGGALGVNQTQMAIPQFDLWSKTEKGLLAWKTIEKFEDNVIEHNKNKIEGAYQLRNLIEGATDLITSNKSPEKKINELIERGFVNDEVLKNTGNVISDIIENIKYEDDKAQGNEFMFPNMTNEEALILLEETLDADKKLIPQKINNLMLLGNAFVSGLKYAKAGEKTQLVNQITDYFSNMMLTRGYGANLTLMPDVGSKGAVARLYEPMIEKLLEEGKDKEADLLAEEYERMYLENIDENGRLKPYSKGIILGYDAFEKLGIKPGDKVFIKLTPTDDLHSLVPVQVIGKHNKPGMLTYNTEYLTSIVGRDFDKDAMQIIVRNGDTLTGKDFDTLWNHYTDNKMLEGVYKKNSGLYAEKEKINTNGVYEALGKGFEYNDPTKTPQSDNYYNKVQDSHGNVGSMIVGRNIITNAFRNLEWEKDNNGNYITNYKDFELIIKPDMHDRVNQIIQKMVDKYDHVSYNPNDAILDEFISKINNVNYHRLNITIKKKERARLSKELKAIGGYGINNFKRQDNFSSLDKSLNKNINPNGNSVSSKVTKALLETNVNTSHRPEIIKYKFNNKIAQNITKATTNLIQEYYKKLPNNLSVAIFDAYKGSKYNIGQHFQQLFGKFNELFVGKNTPDNMKQQILNSDVFTHINSEEFRAFTSNHGWKEIASGTILNDLFESNQHKHPNFVDNKVYKDGTEYQFDGWNGYLVKGDNKIRLDKIFNGKGELTKEAEWINKSLLESPWLRSLVDKKDIVSDNAKADLLGRTIANTANYISSKIPEIKAPDLFSMILFNETGNAISINKSGKAKEGYDKTIYKWMYPKEKINPNKLKAVSKETAREVKFDPMVVAMGAKKMGLDPTVGNKKYIDFYKELANELGEKAFGKNEAHIKDKEGKTYGMPDLTYSYSNLDIRTPKRFIKSLNDLIGKAQADNTIKELGPITTYSKDDYKEVFDKILAPEIKKLMGKKGQEQGWDTEKIELYTNQYIRNYGPDGLDAMADYLAITNGGKTKDFKLKTNYVTQLVMLSNNLKKHFDSREGGPLSFLRPFGSRDPIGMINDYTPEEDKRNYSKDHIIAETVEVVNGKVTLVKDVDTGTDIKKSNYYKVKDLVDRKLGISLGHNTLSKPYIEYIEPRNFIEKISQSGEASIKEFIDNDLLGKDIKNKNNEFIVDAVEKLKIDNTVNDLLNNMKLDSKFNGIFKPYDTQISYNNKTADLKNEERLNSIVKEIKKDWYEQEVNKHNELENRYMEELAKKGEDYEPESINSEHLQKYIDDHTNAIKSTIKLKILSTDTANNLIALSESMNSVVKQHENDLTPMEQQEIYKQTDNLRKEAEKLLSPNNEDIIKAFRNINYTDIKAHDIIDDIFYKKSQETISQYNEHYKELSEKWAKSEYIIRKDMNPKLFKDFPGSDSYPLFPYLSKRLLKEASLTELTNKQFLGDTEKTFKKEIKALLKMLTPDVDNKTLIKQTNTMWNDLLDLNQKRLNINQKLYSVGHNLGLEGFENSLEVAEADDVFKKGYELRKEITRQWENKLKRLNDEYEISMIDADQSEFMFDLQGIDIDLGDFLIEADPSLANNTDLFTYNIDGFRNKIKNKQISAISALENVLKTSYIKKYPNQPKVVQTLVMSELGKVSGNKSIYNKHFNRDQVKEMEFETGTDSFVRYVNKKGDPYTINGRILGKRTLQFEMVKDEEGNDRIINKDFLFVVSDNNNSNRLYVINTDAINDVVTGKPFGGRFAQPTMLDQTIKRQYNKMSKELLDEMQEGLSQKSKFINDNRRESDDFIKNVDQKMQYNDIHSVMDKFENVMQFTQEKIDKSFSNRLGNMQDVITNSLVADNYLGLRYLAKTGVMGGIATVGILGAMPALTTMGLAGIGLAGTGYLKRGGRIMFSNMLGNTAWAVRNSNDSRFMIGNIATLFNTLKSNIGLENKDDNTGLLAKTELMQLEIGTETLAKDMFTMTEDNLYNDITNINTTNKSIKEVWREKRLTDKYLKEFEKINKQVKEWTGRNKTVNEDLQNKLNELTKKYNDKNIKLEFKDTLPFINGKAMNDYQAKEIGTMALLNYLLSFKGGAIKAEVLSAKGAYRNGKRVLDQYSYNFEKRAKEFPVEEDLFRHNLLQMAVHKSIGNYSKSSPQYTFLRRTSEMFSRYSLEQKLDQTLYLKQRNDIYKSIMNEFKKDKEFSGFIDYIKGANGLPLGDYKISNPNKEAGLNLSLAIIGSGLKLAGIGIVADVLDEANDWFGLSFVSNEILKAITSVGLILGVEDGKSPNSKIKNMWWDAGRVSGGHLGFGTSMIAQEVTAWGSLTLYDYYYNEMPYRERQKVKKHIEKLEKEKSYDSMSKLVPVPGLNTVIKEMPKIEEKASKDE